MLQTTFPPQSKVLKESLFTHPRNPDLQIKLQYVSEISTYTMEEILKLASTTYPTCNPIWRHLKVDRNESYDFFSGYLRDADRVILARDASNNKIIASLVGVELFTDNLSNILNWQQTPKMGPWIALLKQIVLATDMTKIQNGRKFFAKGLFLDLDKKYQGLGLKLNTWAYKCLYEVDNFNSFNGLVSNPKVMSAGKKMWRKNGVDNSTVLVFVDHKDFVYEGRKPFDGNEELNGVLIGTVDLQRQIGDRSQATKPKL